MSPLKQRLEEIIKEELQKEGLLDFFKKKKPEPMPPAAAPEPEPEEDIVPTFQWQAAIDATARALTDRGVWKSRELYDNLKGTWFLRKIEGNAAPDAYNEGHFIDALSKTFPSSRPAQSIRFLEQVQQAALDAAVARAPEDTPAPREDEYEWRGGDMRRVKTHRGLGESKTNDNMTSLMENWRKYEKKTLLTENKEVDEGIMDYVPGSSARKMKQAAEKSAQGNTDVTDLEDTPIHMDSQTSFKIFAGKPQLAAKVMQSILKGGPTFKALQAAQGEFAIKSPELIKQWVDSIGGIEVFAKRAAAIGAKIPEQGLAKKDMPFLPGPKDAQGEPSDVEDALKPGGKFNVDIMEKTNPPAPNTFIGIKDPNAQDYMQAGLKDGDPNDDNIEIKMNGEFPAAEGIPTQTNILFPKALGMALHGDKGKPLVGGKIGAYASTEGHILDGHHRWAATMLNDPSANIGTFAMIDMNKAGMMNTIKHLTAIGNALGNKTKTK